MVPTYFNLMVKVLDHVTRGVSLYTITESTLLITVVIVSSFFKLMVSSVMPLVKEK